MPAQRTIGRTDKSAFVAALQAGSSVADAAALVGRSRQAMYWQRSRDPVLALAWDAALHEAANDGPRGADRRASCKASRLTREAEHDPT